MAALAESADLAIGPLVATTMLAAAKLLALAAAVALLMLLLSSSALAREQPTAAPVQLWHAYRGEEQRALEQVIAAWNAAHPQTMVEPLALPWEVLSDKLTSAIPRGHGPDLFISAHEHVGAFAEGRLLAPLERSLPAASLRVFLDGMLPPLRYRKHLYGLPLAFKSTVLFYNKALLERPPATTDEMIAEARRLSDPARGRYGLAYEAATFYHHAGWLHGFGASVFDGKHRPRLDTPVAARSLEFAANLVGRERIVPEDPTATLVAQLFNDQRAAMVINGPWFVGEIRAGLDFGVAPLPRVSPTGKPARPFLTVEAVFLCSHARRRQAALDFARHLATDPAAARLRALSGRQAVALRAAWDDPAVASDPVLAAFRAQLPHTVAMDSSPAMRAVWEPASLALRRTLRGAATARSSLGQAQRQIDASLRPPPPRRPLAPYLAALIFVAGVSALYAWRRARRAGLGRRLRRSGFAYAYLAPAALAMLVLVIVPFVVGAAISFFHHRGGHFTFIGLGNFLDILGSRDFRLTEPHSFYFTLVITVLWTAANVALHVGLGLGLALLLRDPWLRLRGLYRILLIVPWAVPNYITALIWKGMFHRQFGALNGLLDLLGVPPVSWFAQFSTAFTANLLTNTWLGFPFMMVVSLGALQSIPRELEEAAAIDGASRWQRFRHITLPLLRPALFPAVILGTVWTFNQFNIIYLVSNGEPDGATDILISEAYRWAFQRQQAYGYAAAYAVLIFLVLLLYSRVVRRVTGASTGALG